MFGRHHGRPHRASHIADALDADLERIAVAVAMALFASICSGRLSVAPQPSRLARARTATPRLGKGWAK